MARTLSSALVALASAFLCTSAAQAQAFTNPYMESQMRPYNGPQEPYDGAPFWERYGSPFTYTSPPLMFGRGGSYMWSLYHADKIARAQAFGYRLPDAYYESGMVPGPPPEVHRHGLFGFGFFGRIRDE